MKYRTPLLLVAALFAAFTTILVASSEEEIMGQLDEIWPKVEAKKNEGKNSESDFAPELKTIDEMLSKLKAEKSELAANVTMLKAQIYAEALDQPAKAVELLKQVQSEYAGSEAANGAAYLLEKLGQKSGAEKEGGG
ncbi:MAG: tetratricopeptide repeat protein [Chthoniobacterales bacterium]